MTTNLDQFAMTRAVWRDGRIFHARAFAFAGPARLSRLGVRPVDVGEVKIDGMPGWDWVTGFRVLAWDGWRWQVVKTVTGLKRSGRGRPIWFSLGGLETTGLLIEALQCEMDGGWTGWKLATERFVLEGSAPAFPLAADTRLALAECRPTGDASLPPGEARFRSRHMEVGFGLGRAGFRHLAVDSEGLGRTRANLLQLSPIMWSRPVGMSEYRTQGIRLHAVGAPPAVGVCDHNVRGSVAVRGRTVTYDLEMPETGQRYRLRWEVGADRLHLSAERVGERPLRAWYSSAWQIAFDSRVAPVTNLARVTRVGETGGVTLPALVHAPGFGTWRVDARGSGAGWRADSIRPSNTVTSELKLGEEAQPEGDYLLLAGRHKAELEFVVTRHTRPVRRGTPAVVRRALDRCAITAMTYRPDTATFANNGNSTHAILCADTWSALVPCGGRLLPHLHARDLLRDSLERHLNGGPSSGGAGGVIMHGRRRRLEDEQLMSGTAFLLGLAESGLKWPPLQRRRIDAEVGRMRVRDLDGDGLVESPHRRGISGQHQWATNWWDVISFGWKDAFANALLYPALMKLGEREWAGRLRESYWREFYNERTGWLAGWRCRENRLHDYAFLFVNGAAVCHGLVDARPAREIIGRLWDEMQRMGPPDYRMGLPGNLWNIPYEDQAIPMAEGVYENRALTLSQARHFIGALYRVGMTKEGDALLHPMLESLADGTAFGGFDSGVDWRRWDGASCGYEGLLSDQFGVLAIAMQLYGLAEGRSEAAHGAPALVKSRSRRS